MRPHIWKLGPAVPAMVVPAAVLETNRGHNINFRITP